MKKRFLNLSGRAGSAADLTPDVCLAAAARSIERPHSTVLRPTSRRTRAQDIDNRSDPAPSGRLSVSVASPPLRSLIRMHLIPASRG